MKVFLRRRFRFGRRLSVSCLVYKRRYQSRHRRHAQQMVRRCIACATRCVFVEITLDHSGPLFHSLTLFLRRYLEKGSSQEDLSLIDPRFLVLPRSFLHLRHRTKIDIDPLLSYWTWTTKLDATLPKGVSESVGKLATRVTFAVDDKVQDVDETSDIARWLASMDTPGLVDSRMRGDSKAVCLLSYPDYTFASLSLTSLILRPCNIGRVSPPRAFVLK